VKEGILVGLQVKQLFKPGLQKQIECFQHKNLGRVLRHVQQILEK
jgi:hypothetical protein